MLDPSAIGMSGPRQEANWPVATLIALIPAGAVAAVSMFSWQPLKILRFAGHAKSIQVPQWTRGRGWFLQSQPIDAIARQDHD